jgi:hypothetical protein
MVALKGMPSPPEAGCEFGASSLVQAVIMMAIAAMLYIIAFFITDINLCYL